MCTSAALSPDSPLRLCASHAPQCLRPAELGSRLSGAAFVPSERLPADVYGSAGQKAGFSHLADKAFTIYHELLSSSCDFKDTYLLDECGQCPSVLTLGTGCGPHEVHSVSCTEAKLEALPTTSPFRSF